jgi:hypothetical protein
LSGAITIFFLTGAFWAGKNTVMKLIEPTERRYNLSAKVTVKHVTYRDEQSKGISNAEADIVCLIPQESTERDLFFGAWLPDTLDGSHELGIMMGHPVGGTFRAAIRHGNEWCREKHLFVMTKWVEDILKSVPGQITHFHVLGEQEVEAILGHD